MRWLAFVLLVGCDRPTQSEPSEPCCDDSYFDSFRPSLDFRPRDLTSAIRDDENEPVYLSLFRGGDMDEVLRRLVLSDTQGASVPFTTRIENYDSEVIARIEPVAPLASAWHELRVDLTGLEIDPQPTLVPRGNGIFVTRFHPDSEPVIREVEVCESKESKPTRVEVMPSEGVVAQQAFAELVTVTLGGRPCEHIGDLTFECGKRAADDVTVTLEGDLMSRRGRVVKARRDDPDATRLTLPIAEAHRAYGCMSWYLP